MFQAFRERRPWCAALIAFFVDPLIAMLYLGRGWIALIYFALELAEIVFIRGFLPSTIHGLSSEALSTIAIWMTHLVGAVHSVVVARRLSVDRMFPRYSRWYVLVAISVGPVLLALGLRTFLFQLFDTPSGSMIPTLNVGDYFVVSKSAYRSTVPEPGDLIVFNTAKHTPFVKRVVGLGGDRIQMIGGVLQINGKPVRLKMLGSVTVKDEYSTMKGQIFEETLTNGRSYRVLNLTNDGPFDNTDTYTVPAGHLFVMGDNRDNSNDSRADVGYVTETDVVGKVTEKCWDGQKGALVWQEVK